MARKAHVGLNAHRLVVLLAMTLLIAACGGASGDGNSNDGEETPFEGVGDAANNVTLLQSGPLTLTADPGHAWVEVDGQRFEFSTTDSEVLDCIVNDEQFSVIFRDDQGTELRLSGLLLPDGWNPQLSVNASGERLLNGSPIREGKLGLEGESLSYEGSADVLEAGAVASQKEVSLAANCSS